MLIGDAICLSVVNPTVDEDTAGACYGAPLGCRRRTSNGGKSPSQHLLNLYCTSRTHTCWGRLLTHEWTHAGNVPDALEIYEQVRLPFVNGVVQRSHKAGRYFTFSVCTDGSVPALGSLEALDRVRTSIEDAWELQSDSEWGWGHAEKRWRAERGMRAML